MTATISILIALVPAAHIWWSGRRLASRIDDPAFPELRFAASKRTTTIFVVSVVAATVLSPGIGWLLFLLAAFAALIANYPARRRVFDESWGLWSYLDHTLRFWSAMLGAWIVLAFTPAIAQAAGHLGLLIAIPLAVLVFIWGRANATAFPRIMRGKPLDRPELSDRFAAVLARARCRRPRVFEAGAPGGRWVNGIAVPSLWRSAVVLTTDLLNELSPREATAIFAHEVAHLEYFEGGPLRRREIVATLLVSALVALMVWLEPGSEAFTTLAWAWPLVIVLALAKTMGEGQAQEHASDLRAVELVGDAEVVASALTRIHLAMRMPRRWDASREDRFSHPSLARRLRAIREGGGGEAARPAAMSKSGDEPLLLRDAERAGDAVLLDDERLVWLRGLPADCADPESVWRLAVESRAIRYGELSDLRLDVSKAGYRLIAIDAAGQSSAIQIRPDDVARVKSVLEHTDLQVVRTSPGAAVERARRARRALQARILACIAAIAALLPPMSLSTAVVAGVALWRPAFASLAAAGVMGVAAVALHLMAAGQGTATVMVQALAAAALLAVAVAWRRGGVPDAVGAGRAVGWTLAGLGVLHLVQGLGRLAGALPAMQLHLWARYRGGFILVLAAAAVVLWHRERRRSRVAAAACAFGVAALLAVGSGWFARTFGGDPLSSPGPAARPETLRAELLRQVDFDAPILELRVSPSGARVAARVVSDGYTGSLYGPPFRVELDGGSFWSVRAADLEFVDDEVIAYVDYVEDGRLVLKTARLGSTVSPEWEISLPAVTGASLWIDAGMRTWRVDGEALQESSATRLSGHLGDSDYDLEEWRVEEREGAYVSSLHPGRGTVALAVMQRLPSVAWGSLTTMLLTLGLGDYPITSELWTAGPSARPLARTASLLWCTEPPFVAELFICSSAIGSSRTHIWSVDAESGELRTLTVLSGAYYDVQRGAGDLALARTWNQAPLLIDLSSGRTWRVDLPAALAEEALAGVDGSRVGRLISMALGGSGSGRYIHAAALGVASLAIAGSDDAGSRVSVLGVSPPKELPPSR